MAYPQGTTGKKKMPGEDYATNPTGNGPNQRSPGKGMGLGVGVPQRGAAPVALPATKSAPAPTPRYGSERGPKPTQMFRPQLPPARPMPSLPRPDVMPQMQQPGAMQQQGGPTWHTGGPSDEQGKEWTGQNKDAPWNPGGNPADDPSAGDVLGMYAAGTGPVDAQGNPISGLGEPGASSTGSMLDQVLGGQAPQMNQDYEDALVAEYEAEQAKNLKQLYEQAGATGTGASGSFQGPLEGMLTAGTTGLMGLKADIQFKNAEMQQDWAKMKTSAYLDKYGKELDSQTKAAIAAAANEHDSEIEQQKIDMTQEAQDAMIQQDLEDSLAGSWKEALDQSELDWDEETKAKGQYFTGAIEEAFANGDMSYGEAEAAMNQIIAKIVEYEQSGKDMDWDVNQAALEADLQAIIDQYSTPAQ